MRITRRARLLLAAVPLVACVLLLGCRSYPWAVFRWNFLAPTPYLRVAQKPEPKSWNTNDITFCWIGHATVLLNLKGTTILTDPVLVKRLAPPSLGGHNLGIRRITELPLTFADLPTIDIVLLSHAHYDHWDVATLKRLSPPTTAVIPAGTTDFFPAGVLTNVVELPWGATTTVGPVVLEAFEVEHWGERPLKDKVFRGYNGYVISKGDVRIAFVGDSAFQRRGGGPQPVDWRKRIGARPVDACILPIGDSTYWYNHMSPEEAWSLYGQMGATWLLPTHWRTFVQSPPDLEPPQEPIRRLRAAAKEKADRIAWDTPGATFILKTAAHPATKDNSE